MAKRAYTEMKQVLCSARHRNGVCGEPFFVSIFRSKDGKRMLSVRFDNEKGIFTAAFDLDLLNQNNCKFFENSYRGDYFDEDMKLAEKRYYAKQRKELP
jgi:hypothetical protein